jgi:CheY-like chemotaxis protein
VPVIMLTAKADDELRVKLLRRGVQDYIHKPFSAEELLAKAGGLLKEKERKNRQLQQSEAKFQALFNSMDEGFCIIEVIFDDDGKPEGFRFLEANPAFTRQSGLQDVLAKPIKQTHPEHAQQWLDIFGSIILTGKPARFTNETKQLHRWYEVYAFRVGRPEESKVAVLFKDILPNTNNWSRNFGKKKNVCVSQKQPPNWVYTTMTSYRDRSSMMIA